MLLPVTQTGKEHEMKQFNIWNVFYGKYLQNHTKRTVSGRWAKTAGTVTGCLVLLLLYGCTPQPQTPAVTLLEESAPQTVTDETAGDQTDAQTTDEPQTIAVYVCGAVASPGVYELPEGSRVYEALEQAGGLTKDAAQTAVNQAQRLTDGQMLAIPTVEEAAEQSAKQQSAQDGLVNINTADAQELKTLPGIGDAKAAGIIAYREAHGAFRSIEEIKNIEGIKDGVYAKLQDCIKVE